MLQAIFGPDVALGPPSIGSFHALTEGNPFFIEEVLMALLVAGDLTRTDGLWRARPLVDVRVPRTATEAVGRRLEGLSEAARRIAAIAAVAGRRFEFRLLQSVTLHSDTELRSLLRELVDAQLVVEESADRFAFRHALTREAIRAQLLARERVALHQAIAAALEHFESAGAEADESLAYHAFEAGAWEVARRAAHRAAEHALALGAPREALQQIERAMSATVHLGEPPEMPLIIARGRIYETLGEWRGRMGTSIALEAARDARDRPAEWAALHALGRLWTVRDYALAGRYRRDALDVARAMDDPILLARSLNQVATGTLTARIHTRESRITTRRSPSSRAPTTRMASRRPSTCWRSRIISPECKRRPSYSTSARSTCSPHSTTGALWRTRWPCCRRAGRVITHRPVPCMPACMHRWT